MFNPTKPIHTTQANIDNIISIKRRIATELVGFTGNIDTEWNRLFNLYIGQNTKLKKITNSL